MPDALADDHYWHARDIPEIRTGLIGARVVDVSEKDRDPGAVGGPDEPTYDFLVLLFDNGTSLTIPMDEKGFDIHTMGDEEGAPSMPTPIPAEPLTMPETIVPPAVGIPGRIPPASQTPILDAARATLSETVAHGTGLAGGLTASDGQLGAEVRAAKVWNSGWSIAGMASWAKQKGWAAAALVGWTPKGGSK